MRISEFQVSKWEKTGTNDVNSSYVVLIECNSMNFVSTETINNFIQSHLQLQFNKIALYKEQMDIICQNVLPMIFSVDKGAFCLKKIDL